MMLWFTDSVFMRGKETRQKKRQNKKKTRKKQEKQENFFVIVF